MGQNSQKNILIKNHLASLNFNAIFEFVGQVTIRCIYYYFFLKGVDNFEIEHKTW